MTTWIFIVTWALAFIFYMKRVGINLSLSSVGFGLLLIIHGPFYWIYSRYWLFKESWVYKWYSSAELSVPESKSTAVYDHLERLSQDSNLKTALLNLDLGLSLLFVGVIAGIWFVDYVTSYTNDDRQRDIEKWGKVPIEANAAPIQFVNIKIIAAISISLVLIIVYLYYDKIEAVQKYFFSSAGEFEKIRWRRAFGGFPYPIALFLSSFSSILSVYLITDAIKRNSTLLIASIVLILLIIFGKMAYLSKAPIVVFLVQLALTAVLLKTLNLNFVTLIKLVSMGLVAMLTMVFVANGDVARIQDAVAFLFYRVFMIPNESLVEYFSVFPSKLSHTLGMDNKFIAAISGQARLDQSYFRVAEIIRGEGGSTTNGMFIADAWAQFGWWGVFSFPILFGALIRYLDVILIRNLGKTPISIAALATGYYGVFIAMNTSIFTASLTGGLLVILPIVWLIDKSTHRRSISQCAA
jgi:oligosaccharide repeat unit polymerase